MTTRTRNVAPPSPLNVAVTDYLRKNKSMIKMRYLERLIEGMPYGTLAHAIAGTQPLPEKWAIPIASTLRAELYSKVLDNIVEVEQLGKQIEELVNDKAA